MLRHICFFTYFFTTILSDLEASSVDFSNLSLDEHQLVHNLVPPSVLTGSGDACGDYSLSKLYENQAEKAILKHRADLKKRAEIERLQGIGFLLADTPLEDWGVTIPDPELVIRGCLAPSSSTASSSSSYAAGSEIISQDPRKRVREPIG